MALSPELSASAVFKCAPGVKFFIVLVTNATSAVVAQLVLSLGAGRFGDSVLVSSTASHRPPMPPSSGVAIRGLSTGATAMISLV